MCGSPGCARSSKNDGLARKVRAAPTACCWSDLAWALRVHTLQLIMRMLRPLLVVVMCSSSFVPRSARAETPQLGGAYCSTAYAEDLASLSAHARELEMRTPAYSFAIRTTATYECVSYAANGDLLRAQRPVTAHGTGFAFRAQGDGTLLLTNDHVAEWPSVTDDDHVVDGVPTGCKRVSDALSIVDDDRDDYAGDDIPLERVVVDPQLDIAILRAKARLQIMPWKLGTSAGLEPRDLVEVKGFPLGAFRATNVGKVISAHDHDEFREWDHDDFVIDALLSQGNSGSPVLAVSCKTGEFELVGVYHARYSRGSALNVVVSIDQLRQMVTTLKPIERPKAAVATVLDGKARQLLLAAARGGGDPAFFAFGGLTAQVTARADGTLLFVLYSPEFPKISRPLMVLEDAPAADASTFGELAAAYLGGPHGLREHAIDPTTGPLLSHALDLARHDALDAIAYRAARDAGVGSRAESQSLALRKRTLERTLAAQADVTDEITSLAANATSAANVLSLAEIEAGHANAIAAAVH